MSASSEKKGMNGFLVLPKRNQKVTSPKWSRTMLWSFRSNLVLKFTISMAPRPPRHQMLIFRDVPGFHYKTSAFCRRTVSRFALCGPSLRKAWCDRLSRRSCKLARSPSDHSFTRSHHGQASLKLHGQLYE